MIRTSLDFEVHGFRVRAQDGGQPPGHAATLDFLVLHEDMWIGTIACAHPDGFPESWDDRRAAWVRSTALGVSALAGIQLDFPRTRAILEAAALYRLRQEGLISVNSRQASAGSCAW